MPTLALLPSREKVARNAPDEGAFAATTQLHQTHPSPVTHYVSATLSLKGEREKRTTHGMTITPPAPISPPNPLKTSEIKNAQSECRRSLLPPRR